MFAQALITGAPQPLSLSFIHALLRQRVQQLLLCGELAGLRALHAPLLAWSAQQAAGAELLFFPFGRGSDQLPWEQLEDLQDTLLLLHGQTLRATAALEDNACRAVRANVLLTRQILQQAISCSPDALVILSSDQAMRTDTALGASLAAAEASILEASAALHDVPILVMRFPACLEPPTDRSPDPADRAWRREQAVRAALACLAAVEPGEGQHQLIRWRDPLQQPALLHRQPLEQAVRQPPRPLLPWLESLEEPLARNDAVQTRQLLGALWAPGLSG